jgi:hypothetical protein
LVAPPVTGSVTDPEFRRRRASHAAQARTSLDHHVAKVIEAAPSLTAEQVEHLRALLPPAGPDNVIPLERSEHDASKGGGDDGAT